jgi:hypothetical protein
MSPIVLMPVWYAPGISEIGNKVGPVFCGVGYVSPNFDSK